MRKRDSFRLVFVALTYCVLNIACTPAVLSTTPPQSSDGHVLEIQDEGARCFEMSSGNGTDGAENHSTTVCPFIDLRPKPDG